MSKRLPGIPGTPTPDGYTKEEVDNFRNKQGIPGDDERVRTAMAIAEYNLNNTRIQKLQAEVKAGRTEKKN